MIRLTIKVDPPPLQTGVMWIFLRGPVGEISVTNVDLLGNAYKWFLVRLKKLEATYLDYFFGWRSFSTFLALSWQLPQKWPQWRCQRLTEVSRQKETEKRPKICFPWNNRETNRQNCMFDFNTKRTSLHISNFSRREINLVPRCLGAILKMARVSRRRTCFFGTADQKL